MCEIGYPPGYIEVEDEPSGIIIYGDDEPKHECEDGEIVETAEPGSEEKKMIVAFPGVNAPIPENADELFTCAGDTQFGFQVHCTTLCGGVLGSYLSAHRKKDGSYHNTYTEEKCVEVEKDFHENQLQSTKDITYLPPILDTAFGRHHGGFERGMGSGWSRRSHQYSGTSDARVEALSTQIQEKDKEMAEKIEQLKEVQKEEIRTLEAKMQAQLQAQAKRFMDVMRMPLSAFNGSSSQDGEEVSLPHYTRH